MQVKFWGTRGSVAISGKDKMKYGGSTSCVEVRSQSGTLIVIDCGTGAYPLGQQLVQQNNGKVNGHMLITHTHWDHIQGFPFFAPYFIPGNEWHIYGPSGFGPTINRALSDQMQYTYFPVSMEYMAAQMQFHDLVEGSFKIGDITVRAKYLNHPALTLGYRLEADGASVVYSCDHEPHSHDCALGHGEIYGNDLGHAEFLAGADLVIHDSQYIAEEYHTKMGWGHSTYEYAFAISDYAEVRKLAYTHHDPTRTDKQIETNVRRVSREMGGKSKMKTLAASEGTTITLKGSDRPTMISPVAVKPVRDSEVDAFSQPLTALMSRAVLLNLGTQEEIQTVEDILKTDSIKMVIAKTEQEVFDGISSQPISLVVTDMDLDIFSFDKVLEALKSRNTEDGTFTPIIAISSSEYESDSRPKELKDWIIKPFSIEYLRTRIRAALLQEAGRWSRAPIQKGEEARLAEIQRYGLMMRKQNEVYDRVTKLAAAHFDMPISLFTIVDMEHQFFKSRYGMDLEVTSRDQSFSAHALASRDPLIVPDTHLDDRFADNPLVSGEFGIRFFAGIPVFLPSGHCVGTLCVLDTKPRSFADNQIQELQDFAVIIEQELARERNI